MEIEECWWLELAFSIGSVSLEACATVTRCQQPDVVDRRAAVSARHGVFSHLRVGKRDVDVFSFLVGGCSSLPVGALPLSLAWPVRLEAERLLPVAQAFCGDCDPLLLELSLQSAAEKSW